MSREFTYSTDPDWCAKCKHIPCDCPKPKGGAKMRLEKSGRGGKTVTVLFNLTQGEPELKELLKQLQKACGTGGTLKDGTIELQGDHRDRIETTLASLGMKVKRAGG